MASVLKTDGSNPLQVRVLHPPPIFRIRILGDCCLALAMLGLGRNEDFEGIFEVAKQFLPAQTEVRRAQQNLFELLFFICEVMASSRVLTSYK